MGLREDSAAHAPQTQRRAWTQQGWSSRGEGGAEGPSATQLPVRSGQGMVSSARGEHPPGLSGEEEWVCQAATLHRGLGSVISEGQSPVLLPLLPCRVSDGSVCPGSARSYSSSAGLRDKTVCGCDSISSYTQLTGPDREANGHLGPADSHLHASDSELGKGSAHLRGGRGVVLAVGDDFDQQGVVVGGDDGALEGRGVVQADAHSLPAPEHLRGEASMGRQGAEGRAQVNPNSGLSSSYFLPANPGAPHRVEEGPQSPLPPPQEEKGGRTRDGEGVPCQPQGLAPSTQG